MRNDDAKTPTGNNYLYKFYLNESGRIEQNSLESARFLRARIKEEKQRRPNETPSIHLISPRATRN